ncbi:unnamed protein product [Closterium sp. NIES-65]|nr:unnamed protein product [Closterium sp. NIES-65]
MPPRMSRTSLRYTCPTQRHGRPKIAGFDYVTTRRAAASGEQHAVVGVRGYVDPHLLLTQEHTPTNDLYSLGVVLLQLLSGRISDASGKTMPEFFREAVSIEGALGGGRVVSAERSIVGGGRVVSAEEEHWGGGRVVSG